MHSLTSLLLVLFYVGLLFPYSIQAQEPLKTYHSFCSNGRYGIFDESGKILISPQYDRADTDLEHGVIRVNSQGKVGLIDLHGNPLLPIEYDAVGPVADGLRRVLLKGTFHYLNEKGVPAFDFTALLPVNFKFGYAALPISSIRQVLIDRNGRKIFEEHAESTIWVLSPKVAIYQNGSGTGWIDLPLGRIHPSQPGFLLLENGVLVLTVENNPTRRVAYLLNGHNKRTRRVEGFVAITKDRKILVRQKNTSSLLEIAQHEIIDPEHISGIGGQKHAAFYFSHENKHGLINDQGRIIVPPVYDRISLWSNGNAIVRKDGRHGLINDLGQIIVPPIYAAVEWMNDGLIPVRPEGGQWGFIDTNGNAITPFEYEAVHGFGQGMGDVQKNGRWLKINSRGKIFLPLEYLHDHASVQGNLISVVKQAGGCPDYVDKSGDLVFKTIMSGDGESERFIDVRHNKTIWPPQKVP